MLMRELKKVKLNHDFPLQISTCCTICESHHQEKRHLEDLNHNAPPLLYSSDTVARSYITNTAGTK